MKYGQTVTGSINPAKDTDDWTFDGTRGDIVTIRMTAAPGSELDTYLELRNPEGRVETENDDISRDDYNSLIGGWSLRYTGTYTITARGYDTSTGSYILSLTGRPTPPTPAPTPTRTPTPTPTPTSTPTPTPTPTPHCIEFERLRVGASFVVGDRFMDAGTLITVLPFQWSTGEWTADGFAEVTDGGQAGASGNDLMVNNVNLGFDFGKPLRGLTLRFGEYGGNLNIDINDDFRNFHQFSDVDGAFIGDVAVMVRQVDRNRGILQLKGDMNEFFLGIAESTTFFVLGGQELWVDQVCPVY